ncbi:MAG: tetratricopeptide repeat protein [Sphingobacteriaceae bacterium]|nr:tetratricopeptide repeat protein [Sphingobacteriaceae bacterium]
MFRKLHVIFVFGISLNSSLSLAQNVFIEDSTKIIPYLLRGESIYSFKLDSAAILWKKGLELTRKSEKDNPAYEARLKKIEAVFLNDLGYVELSKGRNDGAMQYFDSCMAIQYKLELWDQYALALNNKANIYLTIGDYEKAIAIFIESINFYKKVNKLTELPMVYSNIGLAYQQSGNYAKSVEFLFEAEKQADKYKKKDKTAINLNLAGLFLEEKDTANFIIYNDKAITSAIYYNDFSQLGYAYLNAGRIVSKQNKNLALYYYNKSLTIRRDINDLNGIANSLYNMANLFPGDSALKVYNQALQLYVQTQNKEGQTYTEMAIGTLYKKKNENSKAERIYLDCFKKFNEMKAINGIKMAADNLYQLYKENNNPVKALQFFELHSRLKDSINDFDIRKKTLQKNISYIFEQKENKLKEEHLYKEQLHAKEQQTQRIISYSIGAFMIIVVLFSVTLYRNLQDKKKANAIISEQKKEVEKQKETIELKQKEIVDSINYAQRIQYAHMPSLKKMENIFKRLKK